ncbi:hypothetical protein GCM10009821_14260 [Aeromicrobium halocynthiae]|uniref:Glycosyltransferase RgtA/B/C/D-like domain-containing protein n=1 Tax=Aeromicrobium halocynthiae TaxID=560557 RepID=A0ABN2VXD2_9ACTN
MLAVASVLVCLAVNVHVLWGTDWPAFPYDEVTLLQMARMIAGEAVPDMIRGAGYYPGWAVVIAPIWWFTDDPSVAYRASLWVGVVVSLVTIWPLARVVTRFGLHASAAVVVASFVMTLPARAIQADYSMSERLVTLFAVVSVLAAYRLAERPTVVRHGVFALLLGLLLFSHVRMTVVLAAAAVWLLIRAVRHVWPSLVGLAMVVLAYLLADAAGNALSEALLRRSVTRGDDLVERISNSRWQLFMRVAMGQSWYQSLASYGLVAIGLVVVLLLVWRELRRWDFGATTFVLGATIVVAFISLAQWADVFWLYTAPWVRLDAWVYGRYIDPIATVVVAIGVAALLRGVSRSVLAWGVGLNVLVAVVGAGYLTREVPTWGWVTPAHIPGILPWWRLLPTEPWSREVGIVPTLVNENRIWIIAPLCVLLVLLAAIALRRRPAIVAGGLVALAVVGTLLSAPRSAFFHEVEAQSRDMRPMVTPLVELGADEPIGYVRLCGLPGGQEAAGQNYFGYALSPSPVQQIVEPSDISSDQTVVLACSRWIDGEYRGARRLEGQSIYGTFVWIMPGALQDRLESEGRLLPEFETAPPASS